MKYGTAMILNKHETISGFALPTKTYGFNYAKAADFKPLGHVNNLTQDRC